MSDRRDTALVRQVLGAGPIIPGTTIREGAWPTAYLLKRMRADIIVATYAIAFTT